MLELYEGLFKNTWMLLTESTFPGTTISYAAILFGVAGVSIGFAFLSKIMELSFLPSQRGGNNSNIKVSDDRKNDTK